MRGLFRIIGVGFVAGVGYVAYRAMRQFREDSVFDLGSAAPAQVTGSTNRSISPELLAILADPGDKGPVELIKDGAGKEWLVNRRNGYRYPIEDGIPIMLLEEGEKYKDTSLIAS